MTTIGQADTGLTVGDRAPNWFLPDQNDSIFSFYDKVRGGPIVMLMYRTSANSRADQALSELAAVLGQLQDKGTHVFAVGDDCAATVQAMRTRHAFGDAVTVADPDQNTAAKYGGKDRLMLYVLDANQQVVARIEPGTESMAQCALAVVATLPPATVVHRPGIHAPILLIPHVFSPEECRYLIAQFWARGNEESGTYRVEQGVMVHAPNYGAKRRRDHHVGDKDLLDFIGERIGRRVVPEIKRAFQAQMTRVEEFKIVCYEPNPGGYFRTHRDNSAPQTRHRRFAMTLNLNAEEYEGGELRFPEYGGATYKPAAGEAVVFSCNLLHEATDVIGGRRFVMLSFFYDEAGQKQRAAYQEAMKKGQVHVSV